MNNARYSVSSHSLLLVGRQYGTNESYTNLAQTMLGYAVLKEENDIVKFLARHDGVQLDKGVSRPWNCCDDFAHFPFP